MTASGLLVACWAEGVKLRRSLLPALTVGGICLAPLMSALFVAAMRSAPAGVAAGKAALFAGTPDLPGYFGLLLTVYAAGGLGVCGIVTAWVFGREFSDRTAIDLLALPVPRTSIVVGKYVTVFVWCAVLTAVMFAVGLLVAAVLGLPGWSGAAVVSALVRLAGLYGLSIVLMTPVGFAASAGRGYLAPIGLVLLVIVIAQALATVGAGGWFPWAVPALAVGVAGPDAGAVGAASYVLVAATAVAGAVLTAAWWRYADHR